jgi:hypothetical protein
MQLDPAIKAIKNNQLLHNTLVFDIFKLIYTSMLLTCVPDCIIKYMHIYIYFAQFVNF